MQVGIYGFSCRFETETVLPVFKGSTLRGSLGLALRRIACALHHQDCKSCLLSTQCAYTILFEENPRPLTDSIFRSAPIRRPHPYVLVPPDNSKRLHGTGELFSFSVKLFGPALSYLPHLVYAVQEMGKAGLGKGNRHGEGRFRLEAVYHKQQQIFNGQSLCNTAPSDEISFGPATDAAVKRLTLTCHTPLRLKQDNHLSGKLPFHVLTRAALRRIAALETYYGQGSEPALDYRGLITRANGIAVTDSTICWTEFERYSNRQKSAMRFGGITGTITYQGENLSEYLPLLRYCETVHLGKQTSFGLGNISINTENSE